MEKTTKRDGPVINDVDNTHMSFPISLSDEGESRRQLLEDVVGPPIVPISEDKTAAGMGLEPTPGRGW